MRIEKTDGGGEVPARFHLSGLVLAVFTVAMLAFFGLRPALAADAAIQPVDSAGAAPAQTATATEPPQEVTELMRLLADPKVKTWIEQTVAATPATVVQPATQESPVGDLVSERLRRLRLHYLAISSAIDTWPRDIAAGLLVISSSAARVGPLLLFFIVVTPFAAGAIAEALARLVLTRYRIDADSIARPGSDLDRWLSVALRLMRRIGGLILFTLAGMLTFVLTDPPHVLESILSGYFGAVVVVRFTLALTEMLLSPDPAQGAARVVPVDDASALFWQRRIVVFVGWLVFGIVTLGALHTAGVPFASQQLDAYVLGLGLLAIAIEAIWRRPSRPEGSRIARRLASLLLTVAAIALWVLWVGEALQLFTTLLIVVALPFAIRIVGATVANVARKSSPDQTIPLGVTAVFIARGIRSVLIIAAIVLVARAWGIDLGDLSDSDSVLTRVVRSLMSAVVIYLGADLIWQLSKAAIDARIGDIREVAPGGDRDEFARRQARLRTLLPILRNVLFIVVLVVAVLMELSAFGIDIAPLVAGAGVVGVAVGFGAQTLVKDIISGMFFLLDDAFRVGEYIQSGSYKGTVESFSLRSVKLRHHRGPVYTVPFGELGAVQNMSRDWVIEKLPIVVTYDTDLEKARKLIKRVGTDLAADPELGPDLIEPPKMQGVQQFGDYGIQIRIKLVARPGGQFVARRKLLAGIKKTFDENGISFAVPRVQVAGGDAADAAVAQTALAVQQANTPASGA